MSSMHLTGLYVTAPPAGRHGKHGTFPRQFHMSSRSKDYGDGKLCFYQNNVYVTECWKEL